jgi:thioredoxin 1
VTKIPTQVFYDTQGRELYRHIGFLSKKEILDTWKKLGVKP